MKKILLIAYHYPPEGSSSGVLRTLKFSKYLPQAGWQPHVLTMKENCYQQRDEELARDIPSQVVVHRTSAIGIGRYLGIPDRFIGWVPLGAKRGGQIIRREKIQALFSTSPVPSAHLIACLLRKRFGVPWVADFRDPWVEEGIWPRPASLRYRVESFLEKRVLLTADRVTVTTPGLKQELMQRLPQLSDSKVVVIENGFDEEDFIQVGEEIKPDPDSFVMLHAGMVTPDFRDPFPLLEVLAELVKQGKLQRKEVRVCFQGGGSYVESAAFAERVRALGVPGLVEVRPRVSYYEALRCLFRAHALLLLQDSEDTRHLIPAKAFEYLRAGRPVVALTNKGATADLIRETGAGYVMDPKEPAEIRAALLNLFSQNGHAPGRPARAPDALKKYERRSQAERLASVLNGL